MQSIDRDRRAAVHAALGEPHRLALVDELATSDRTPAELARRTGIPSNLLAHHLDVLARAGLVERSRSSGDGRRRYVHLDAGLVAALAPATRPVRAPALFVCTANSARSQLAAAVWREATGAAAASAGTHPAERVHPGARAAAQRHGLDLGDARPRAIAPDAEVPDVVVTVCDRAHEELAPPPGWRHWSIPDPVVDGSAAAFDAVVAELRQRVGALAAVPGVAA